ncbi:MAG TPA: DEAD/DEAH box helicase [Rhodopila sp.]|jgi:ATP-dependent RNA helicase DeaD|nr:DEAD/DEAH box helicase [Rhodopila sp.]
MSFPPVHPQLDAALAARGYLQPTAVQSAVLRPDAQDRDLLVSARTGSGKTVAFGLAAASTLLSDGLMPAPGAPLALVIAPTRELALQVQSELAWLYAGSRIASCVGGMDVRREARALAAGSHIVVGTPGRLGDHLRRGNLDLAALKVVVLDEADEMLDLGFQEELEFILQATPDDRRTLLFSATIPHDIASLARRYQREALRIDTIDRSQSHSDIEYRAIAVAGHEVEAALINTLRWYEAPGALVFCATRDATRRLHLALVQRGFSAVMLSGELSQHERSTALDALRSGRARVGVCTDVAARGIDLPALDLVVHADLPTNPETLLHRSGRTGRAGRKGVSVFLVPHAKRRRAEQVLYAARVRPEWSNAPSPEDIDGRDRERLLADPMLAAPEGTERADAETLLATHDPVAVAAALLRLYRRQLPPAAPVSQAPAAVTQREPRAPGARQADQGGDFVQFRISVGRNNRADPKWLLPLLCRVGNVTKRDIGSIRVFDTDTRFEISRAASEAFAAATADLPPHEPRITQAGDGPMPPAKPFRGKPAGPPHARNGYRNGAASSRRRGPPARG